MDSNNCFKCSSLSKTEPLNGGFLSKRYDAPSNISIIILHTETYRNDISVNVSSDKGKSPADILLEISVKLYFISCIVSKIFLIFTLLPTTQILEYIQLLAIKSFLLIPLSAAFSSIIIRSHSSGLKAIVLFLCTPGIVSPPHHCKVYPTYLLPP